MSNTLALSVYINPESIFVLTHMHIAFGVIGIRSRTSLSGRSPTFSRARTGSRQYVSSSPLARKRLNLKRIQVWQRVFNACRITMKTMECDGPLKAYWLYMTMGTLIFSCFRLQTLSSNCTLSVPGERTASSDPTTRTFPLQIARANICLGSKTNLPFVELSNDGSHGLDPGTT